MPARHVASIFLCGCAAAIVAGLMLPWPTAMFAAVLAVACAIVTAVDIDRFIIPDSANLAILAIGLAETATMSSSEHALPALGDALARGLAAGSVLYLTGWGYRRATGRDGLGLGDVKLAAAGGTCLGWQTLPMALQLAVLLALLMIAGLALLARKMPERHAALPFGACLAPAIWLLFVFERAAAL